MYIYLYICIYGCTYNQWHCGKAWHHGAHMIETCHTYEWDTACIWNLLSRACMCVCVCVKPMASRRGTSFCGHVATIGRLLKIIGLFCRITSLLQGSFAKETYNFKEPRCVFLWPCCGIHEYTYAGVYTRTHAYTGKRPTDEDP